MQKGGIQRLGWSGLAVVVSMFVATTAAAANQPTPPAVPDPDPLFEPLPASTVSAATLWGGFDVSPSSKAAFAGAIYALNGDLSEDGFLIRGSLTVGEYEAGILSGTSDVSFQNANLLIGYQAAVGAAHVSFFVGPDFTHNGDGASADVRGSSWGVRGVADILLPVSDKFTLSTWSTYSTIEDQYFVQGRALYRPSDKFRIGPELAFLGGDTWRQRRLGGHVAFGLGRGEIGVSAGHAWNSESEADDGFYANAIFSLRL